MIVKIPNNLIPERKYIVDFFLKDSLKLDYEIRYHSRPEYVIEFNNKTIKINDHFFFAYKEPSEYLKIKALPNQVVYAENQLIPLDDMPIIYGTEQIFFYENKIVIDADIFASAYFLLTDWESYVRKERNNLHSFPREKSFVFRNRLFIRPIVNEYIEFLRNAFAYLNYHIDRKKFFKPLLLIDVVKLSKLEEISFSKFVRNIFRKREPIDFIEYFTSFGIDTYFFFFANVAYPAIYKLSTLKQSDLITLTKRKNGYPAILFPYQVFNSSEHIKFLKKEFEQLFGKVEIGKIYRSVYSNPLTFQIFDSKISILVDDGFNFDIGFYYGICSRFRSFDFISRKKYNFYILPVIISYEGLIPFMDKPKFIQREIKRRRKLVEFFGGEFVINWENTIPFKSSLKNVNNFLQNRIFF